MYRLQRYIPIYQCYLALFYACICNSLNNKNFFFLSRRNQKYTYIVPTYIILPLRSLRKAYMNQED